MFFIMTGRMTRFESGDQADGQTQPTRTAIAAATRTAPRLPVLPVRVIIPSFVTAICYPFCSTIPPSAVPRAGIGVTSSSTGMSTSASTPNGASTTIFARRETASELPMQ